ncbi:MAG: hypothetical protein ACK4I8_09500, partial [Armatimonadota bacterium]
IWKDGSKRTEFAASFYTEKISEFSRSHDGKWLAVLAREGGKTFVKVFDERGKEVSMPDRTPLGEVSAIQWTVDNKLLMFTERFREPNMAIWSPGETIKFVSTKNSIAPTQTAVLDQRTLFVLIGTTLKRGQIDQETVLWQTIASPVKAFAVGAKFLALVRDKGLQVGALDSQDWQGSVIDNREGDFSDLTFSKDGQWLAYVYRLKPSDPPQLWLAHVPTKQLWRVALNATQPIFVNVSR